MAHLVSCQESRSLAFFLKAILVCIYDVGHVQHDNVFAYSFKFVILKHIALGRQ